MLNLDALVAIANQGSLMLLAAIICYATAEIIKQVGDKAGWGEQWKDYLPVIIYAAAFAAYLIIGMAGGVIAPVGTAFANALLFLILESSAFIVIKGATKLVQAVVAWLQGKVGK